MLSRSPVFLPAALLLAAASGRAQQLAAYDVVWRTPSADASGSMPIGNGEVGANVWCTPDGRLHCYVARTDAFSEASRLLKLGALSFAVTPMPSSPGFEQRLLLEQGCIQVTLGSGDDKVVLQLFVDSDSDVIHVTSDSTRQHTLQAQVRSWRLDEKRLRGEELASSWTMKDAPDDVAVTESADLALDVAGAEGGSHVGWLHHNRSSVVGFTAARQGLPAATVDDVLQGRAFGLLLSAAERMLLFAPVPGALDVATAPGGRHALRIAAPCLQPSTPEAWTTHARELLAATDTATAQQRTAAWWRAFWQRSYVFVNGDQTATVPQNDHPLRIGVDSDGGNRFQGSIEELQLWSSPAPLPAMPAPSLPAVVPLIRHAPGTALPVVDDAWRALPLSRGFRIEARLRQDAAHPIGRIVDKLTAGTGDGFLFDTHPGRALRLIVGDRQLVAKDVLQPDTTHTVGATFDAMTGRITLSCDGKLVADSHPGGRATDPPPPSRLTQALVLQRWIQACGGRGKFPIKFNGSIFTVEPKPTGGQPHDADWRRWGDCFWWQNTRLPYYPMLAQGDFDQQAPLFAFYRRTLAAAVARASVWHSAEGGYWPETMTPFGTHANGDYGWQRDGQPVGKVLCPWWEHTRNQGLELLALLLDRYDQERDDAFLRAELLPIAVPVLQWFATAYPRGDGDRLRLTPTQALETHWHGVEDDLPTVAGLHWCLQRLRTLAPQLMPPDRLQQWAELEQRLPPVPVHTVNGERRLAPAAKYDPSRQNVESPELYAVFPFRLHGLGKPELELARATYRARHDRHRHGWPQDGQLAALLGLVDEARDNVLARLANSHAAHRFPAMWGPNFDWCPDQCHGSNLLDTVQRMLLQCDDGAIRVLPCWPKDWDVSFRLHAPQRTVVECEFRAGKIVRLEVTPAERRAAVVLPD
ncbi:MAG: DUF5703 domain-containing protein [Planctomycetes bacterium]|jgi:hypothetical protein|nr:DUF5703 domain-containing protein [Planctomycetota bacterium]